MMRNKPIITRYVAKKRLNLILHGLHEYENTTSKENMRIIDVGCGDGDFTRALKKKGYSVIGMDQHSPKTAPWMHTPPDCAIDARFIAFKDNTFDVVIALEVVEHVSCFAEINRILKPGGFFFCSTPTPHTDWVRYILVFLGILEAQDFEHHDYVQDLRKAPMKLRHYQKMFMRTSQFAIFTKK